MDSRYGRANLARGLVAALAILMTAVAMSPPPSAEAEGVSGTMRHVESGLVRNWGYANVSTYTTSYDIKYIGDDMVWCCKDGGSTHTYDGIEATSIDPVESGELSQETVTKLALANYYVWTLDLYRTPDNQPLNTPAERYAANGVLQWRILDDVGHNDDPAPWLTRFFLGDRDITGWNNSNNNQTTSWNNQAALEWIEANKNDYIGHGEYFRLSDIDSGYQDVMGRFWVTPKSGTISLAKHSADPGLTDGNNSYSLKGAVYGVFASKADAQSRERSRAVYVGITGQRNADGTQVDDYFVSDELDTGDYWVSEITPSKGYALDDAVYKVTVNPSEDTRVNANVGHVVEEPMSNPVDVAAMKADAATPDGSPQGSATLGGAEFTIRYYDGQYTRSTLPTTATRTWVLRTGADGCAHFSEDYLVSGTLYRTAAGVVTIPLGTVTIVETKAPDGYLLDDGAGGRPKSHLINITGQNAAGTTVQAYNAPVSPNTIKHMGFKLGKVDALLKAALDQGDATLSGAVFSVVNDSPNPVIVDGVTYGPGEECATVSATRSGGAVSAQLGGTVLPHGIYTITEKTPPTGYLLNTTWSKRIEADASTPDGKVFDLTGDPCPDMPMRGGLLVPKIDHETMAGQPLGGATLAGAQMQVRNASRQSVVVDGNVFKPGDIVKTISTQADGTASTGNEALPYGTYTVKEVKPPEGYLPNTSWNATVQVRENGVTITTSEVDDQVKRGDLHFNKASGDTMQRLGRVAFLVTSNTTGESHVLVTDDNGSLDTSTGWAPHSHATNANDAALKRPSTRGEDGASVHASSFDVREASGLDPESMAEGEGAEEENARLLGTMAGTQAEPEAAESGTDPDWDASLQSEGDAGEDDAAGSDAYDDDTSDGDYVGAADGADGDAVEPMEPGEGDVTDAGVSDEAAEPADGATPDDGDAVGVEGLDDNAYAAVEPEDDGRVQVDGHQDGQTTEDADDVLVEAPAQADEPDDLLEVEADESVDSNEPADADEEQTGDRVLDARKISTQGRDASRYEVDESKLNPEAGVWFSGRADLSTEPNDALGALPYDTYHFRELAGSSNEGMKLVEFDVRVYRDGYDIDMGTIDNDFIAVPEILTTLRADDGNRIIPSAGMAKLVDTVYYRGLEAGREYTLAGVLIDKRTGEQVAAEGASASLSFRAKAKEGSEDVVFEIDASELAGTDLVAFEYLSDDQGNPVTSHEDPDDVDQTVGVPGIATTLTAGDGAKTTVNAGEVSFADRVDYENLEPGREYTLEATLHAKAPDGSDAGVVIDAQGAEVTASKTFTPEESCGSESVEFTFPFDSSQTLEAVAFEELHADARLYAEHKDIDDPAQTATATPGPAIEKYVGKDVHQDLTSVDEVFTYDILAYLTADAETVTIRDELVGNIEFADDAASVRVTDLGTENNHLVNGSYSPASGEATVTADGADITEAASVTMEEKRLEVHIDGLGEKGLRGHWVRVGFTVRASSAEGYVYIGENAPVLSELGHLGIPNTASYVIGVENPGYNPDDPESPPVIDGYEEESNTVTVRPPEEPEIEKYVGKDVHQDLTSAEEQFTYDIMAYVTGDADNVTVVDEIVDNLEFAHGPEGVAVADMGVENNHATNGVYSIANEGASVTTEGADLAEHCAIDIEGQRLCVKIADASQAGIRGHWIRVSFTARVRFAAGYIDVVENGSVLSGLGHTGIPNSASYDIGIGDRPDAYHGESNVVTVKPPSEPAIEKYVGKDVHQELSSLDEPFCYDIMGYITPDAVRVTFTDELVGNLAFASDAAAVRVFDMGADNNHRVNGAYSEASPDATVTSGGSDITDKAVVGIEGQRLTVRIDDIDALGLRNTWVRVSFDARATAAQGYENVVDNAPVISLNGHLGIPNRAAYVLATVDWNQRDGEGAPPTIDGPEHGSNTVTVKPPDELSIRTQAANKESGTRDMAAGRATVVDTVSYTGLTPGKRYILKATLIDKDANRPLVWRGSPVAAEHEFTAGSADGSETVEFPNLDYGDLGGHRIVAFEELYEAGAGPDGADGVEAGDGDADHIPDGAPDGTPDGTPLAVHKDVTDADQTITVAGNREAGSPNPGSGSSESTSSSRNSSSSSESKSEGSSSSEAGSKAGSYDKTGNLLGSWWWLFALIGGGIAVCAVVIVVRRKGAPPDTWRDAGLWN